jgi:hypothetical protein
LISALRDLERINVDQELSHEDVWFNVLVDNSAQGIYNELEKLKNLGSTHKRRWIWELCQNALDSAEGSVSIEVELHDQAVIFRHNGHAFDEAEIAHLVCHGSTKRGEGGKLGRWGTGFLTTHLLSKLTKVTGIMCDDSRFSFTLDRRGENAEAIKESMKKSKIEFHESRASVSTVEPKAGFTTEYEYPLDEGGVSVAMLGIEDMRKIARYALALNDEIGSIVLINDKSEENFVKSGAKNVAKDIHLVQVENKVIVGKKENQRHLRIVVAKDQKLSIGAELLEKDSLLYFSDCSDMPKLFVAFPLYTTENFSFPIIINCRDFIPTPDRDGIFMGAEETLVNIHGKAFLARAIPLLLKLIESALSEAWFDVHLLTKLSKPLPRSWLDTDWYKNLLKTVAVAELMKLKVVCSKDKWIAPEDAWFPIPGNLDELWNLAAYPDEDKLPTKDLYPSWASIVDGWATLLDKKSEEFERSLTVDRLVQIVSPIGDLQTLDTMLNKGESTSIQPIDWLNRLIHLLFATNQQQQLDKFSLLPNQNSIFKKRNELRTDKGIDEALKNISKNLGQDSRQTLLHLQILDEAKKLTTPISQDELLNTLLKQVKDLAKADPNKDDYKSANPALFWWLVSNQKCELLAGYPVFCRRVNDKKDEIITYLGGKESLLAPVERWSQKSRDFVGLFPSEFVLSSKYWRESDMWETLQSQNLLICEPIYYLQKPLSEDMLMDSLAFGGQLNEQAEHRIENVNVSDIAFLRLENRGIIDQVRGSKERARTFIKFLLHFAIDFDESALAPSGLLCNCGEVHSVYTANWLWVLKTQKWIPVGKGKQETPSSKNIAALIQNQPEILDNLVEYKPSRFFNNLNVSVSDIMKSIIAKDEESKLALDNATGKLYKSFSGNTKQLIDLAQLFEEEPSMILEFQKKISDLEKVRKNQKVGKTVEEIFRGMFEKSNIKKHGFIIKRTGVGSDYSVEHDFIENGQEQLLDISKGNNRVLIEVKSTTGDQVRMTTTQGQTAVANRGNYVLCVVPIEGEVNEAMIQTNSLFVLDIGAKLEDKVSKVNELQQKSIEVSSVGGDVAIEVTEGQVRFRISKPVWEAGRSFVKFLEYLVHSL